MTSLSISQISEKIKAKALEEGFSAIGISAATLLENDKERLGKWLSKGFHGNMKYMENNLEKRSDPRLIFENARSVISLAINYLPEENCIPRGAFRIARFALGRDYHPVIKKRLTALGDYLCRLATGATYRAFVDSAPLLERSLAVNSKLGRIGKNACLIIPHKGSFFLLAEIITNLELTYDEALEKDPCGNCTICLDSCPTTAITAPGEIDATRCISYITQKPGLEVPGELAGKTAPWIYGCDICQEVCPHNHKAEPCRHNWFEHNTCLADMQKEEWENLSPERFGQLFEGSAISEIGYEGFMRNVGLAKSGVFFKP